MSTLLVTVDALRADHLSQYGYARETMPCLDGLLSSGATRFTAAFSNGTNTGISLPSMLTSRYLGDRYVRTGRTVGTPLVEAGVSTGAIHSNTYFASKFETIPGFETYDDFGVGTTAQAGSVSHTRRVFRACMDSVRPLIKRVNLLDAAKRVQEHLFPAALIHTLTYYEDAARTTDRAVEWLQHVEGEFFLWVHYMDPHRPYGLYLDDPEYCDPVEEDELRSLLSTAGIHPDRITPGQRKRLIDLYDSEVHYLSGHLERLFDTLGDLTTSDETNIVFTADHGEEFGEHGHYYHRNRPYDELIHVPLVVKSDEWPSEVSDQRELLDVAPTICAFHGVDPPSTFSGTHLLNGAPRRVIARGSFVDNNEAVAGRWNGWKCILTGDDEELYDLTRDPREGRDVAADNQSLVERYRASIPSRLFREGPHDEFGDVDGAVERRLEGLGYLE